MKKITAILTVLVLFASVLVAFKPSSASEGVTLMVSHDVKDFPAWKKLFDTDEEFRKSMGLTTEGVYTNIEKPNEVTIVFRAPSVEVVKGLMGNPKLKENMQKAGVVSAPIVRILNKQ